MRMIRQIRRRLEERTQRNQQDEVQTNAGIDDVIRELAAHGLRPEDVFIVRGFDFEWVEVQRGLSPERIEQFRQFDARASQISVIGNQCAVCLNEIQVGTKVLRLDCRHTFCSTCILQWFSTNNTFPYCRRSFL